MKYFTISTWSTYSESFSHNISLLFKGLLLHTQAFNAIQFHSPYCCKAVSFHHRLVPFPHWRCCYWCCSLLELVWYVILMFSWHICSCVLIGAACSSFLLRHRPSHFLPILFLQWRLPLFGTASIACAVPATGKFTFNFSMWFRINNTNEWLYSI